MEINRTIHAASVSPIPDSLLLFTSSLLHFSLVQCPLPTVLLSAAFRDPHHGEQEFPPLLCAIT